MHFIKKSKQDINFKIVNEIVTLYLDYLESLNIPMTYKDISELFRYSICSVLDLSSSFISVKVKELTKGVVNTIKPTIIKYNINNKSIEYKQGFLEACVHCIEMSRKKVDK
jgi:hypothetical protein